MARIASSPCINTKLPLYELPAADQAVGQAPSGPCLAARNQFRNCGGGKSSGASGRQPLSAGGEMRLMMSKVLMCNAMLMTGA